MNQISFASLAAYWSEPVLATSLLVFFNLFGALLLGLLVGYERSFHGRAAGMRTYGLVCMASAALTVIAGYPNSWYGGHFGMMSMIDPTRIIQGIVTGIGFLGAGVIMKDGLNISGLTTAASIWTSSAIGVLVGVGLYAAAILLALLSALCMIWGSRLENWLPTHHALAVVLRFRKDFMPRIEVLRMVANERGYAIAEGSMAISFQDGKPEWHFVAVAQGKNKGASIADLARELTIFEGVETFHLSHARN